MLVILAFVVASSPLHAQERDAGLIHRCEKDGAAARVSVVPERDKGELPCRVLFEAEGEAPEELWRVRYERGACVAKAARKRDLLEADGWRCESEIIASWARDGAVGREDRPVGVERPTDDAPAASGSTPGSDPAGRLIDEADALALERDLLVSAPGRALPLSLEESVSLALRNNRDIESAYLDRTRDALALELAEDQFLPDLEIDGGPTTSRSGRRSASVDTTLSSELPTGGDISLSWTNSLDSDSGETQVTSEIVQPLWRGGGLDANLADLRGARLGFDRGLLNLRAGIIDTITEVIVAHRALTLAQFEIDLAVRSLQRAKDQQRANQRLLAAGRIARFDVVQNQTNIAVREVDLATSELALEDARRNLLQLLDIETGVQLIAEDASTDRPIDVDREQALAIAFANRPDFLEAQLASEEARLALDVARSEGRRIGVDAVLGASYDDTLFTDDDFDQGSFTDYQASLRLNIPFGDVARQQSMQRALLDIRADKISFAEVRNSIDTDITNLVANITTAKSRIDLAERAEILAEAQLKAERIKFARGLSSTLDVILLEDGLIESELSTLNARVTYSDALTELDRALGMTLDSWGVELRR